MSNARAILAIAALGAVAYFLLSGMGKDGQPPKAPSAPSTAPARQTVVPTVAPALKVSLQNEKWRRGGFDTIAFFSFTIANENDFAVRDIEVVCRFFGNSGTVINTRRQTVYETVPAKKKKAVKELSMGFINSQVRSASCEVDDAQRS